MDARITKKRLVYFLSYHWVSFVALIVAAVLLWSFLLTMTSTKIADSQEFVVFNHFSNNAMQEKPYSALHKAIREDGFSYEILEGDINDLPTKRDAVGSLLSAYIPNDMCDLIMVPHIDSTTTQKNDLDEDVPVKETQLFANQWFVNMQSADEYLQSMRAYVQPYFVNGTLDKAKAEADLRAYAKQSKDKRFRTEKQIKNALQGEYERLTLYYNALQEFDDYLAKEYVSFLEMKVVIEGITVVEKCNYAINLCPNKETMGELKQQYSYSIEMEDKSLKATAQDMCVMFFRPKNTLQNNRNFESLLYINMVIRTAIADTQNAKIL